MSDSVRENKTVENIERVFKTVKQHGFEVFISPHYYYPTDYSWNFAGTVERMMLESKEFDRTGELSLDGFLGSGADWLDRCKPALINFGYLANEVLSINEAVKAMMSWLRSSYQPI